MHSLVTNKNVSWPHLIWPTLYVPSFTDLGPAVSEPPGFKPVDTARMDGHTDGHMTSFTETTKSTCSQYTVYHGDTDK